MSNKSVNWIITKAKKYFLSILLLSLLNMICAMSSVIIALYTKSVIDAATNHNVSGVIFNVAVLFIILIVFLLLKVVISILKEKTKSKLEMTFRKDFLKTFLKKEYSYMMKYHSGDVLTRMFSDIAIISDGIVSIVPGIASIVTGAVTAFALLAYINFNFALLFLISGVLIYMFAGIFRELIKNIHKTLQESFAKLRSFMQEIIINLLAVKTNDTNNSVLKKADILQDNHYKIKIKKSFLTVSAVTGLELVFDFGYLVALLWSAVELGYGTITYGTVVAMLQLVTKIQQPFAAVSGILPTLYSTMASVERIIEVENIPDEITGDSFENKEDLNDFTINISNINFSYDRDKVFDDLSFDVKKGEFVAITGSSGIGKSTALKLLLGVLNNYTGSITIDTPELSYNVSKETRSMFSYVPQGNLLFSGSLKENLCFMSENVNDEEIFNALKLSCCNEFVDDLPEGIDTVVGEKGHGLSEGQIQRIAIARALLKKSPVLLLDEATSALDESTEKAVLSNLKSIKGITCVIVSHKKAALEVCDKVYKFEYGKANKV